MGLTERLSNPQVTDLFQRLTSRSRRQGENRSRPLSGVAPDGRRPFGAVGDAIVAVLAHDDVELRARDIHEAVKRLLGARSLRRLSEASFSGARKAAPRCSREPREDGTASSDRRGHFKPSDTTLEGSDKSAGPPRSSRPRAGRAAEGHSMRVASSSSPRRRVCQKPTSPCSPASSSAGSNPRPQNGGRSSTRRSATAQAWNDEAS